MPRPSKRAITSRVSAVSGAKKRQKRARARKEIPDSCSEGGALSSSSTSGGEVEIDSEPEDDTFVLDQPEEGWKEAERQLTGLSRTNAGKTPQSRWYYSHKQRELDREKIQLQRTYGDIGRFFNRPQSEQMQPVPSLGRLPPVRPIEQYSSSQSPSPPPLLPPPGWGPPPSGPLASFDDTFFNSVSFNAEIEQLDGWLKKNKENISGDWLKRVNGVRDLLMFQGSFLYTSTPIDQRQRRWTEHSESISVRLGKGPKYALALRRWERDWFDSRIPPPCPMKGKHIKRMSLFDDEGVTLAVREYLNTALWHANPRGVCSAVQQYLQNQSVYNIMQIDSILSDTNKIEAKSMISERTAQRWLIKLGWVYGRNKKGYSDGHEREDVVHYWEKVFCPKMKVNFKRAHKLFMVLLTNIAHGNRRSLRLLESTTIRKKF